MTGTKGQGGRARGGRGRWTWVVALLVMPALALGAEAKGPLRVGISESYPPLAFAKDGKPAGVEAELAPLVGEQLGTEIVFVPMKFPELIPALEAGKVDMVMSGLSVTDQRRNKVRFAVPYLRVGQMTLIRDEDLGMTVDDMSKKGARVGVKTGTTGEGWAKANLSGATVIGFDTVDEGVEALRAEKVDFFVHDAPTIWRLTGRGDTRDDDFAGIYRPLTKEQIAWAVPSDDEELASRLNDALKQLRASGQLQEVLDRWIPVTKVAVPGDGPQPTAAPATAP